MIDIIIPLYNKEANISDLMNQLVSGYSFISKIIVIDDQSTDNSFSIVDNYRKNYPGLVILKKMPKNSGPHLARMEGQKYTDSEWILLIDADDLINFRGLSHLLSQISSVDSTIGVLYGCTKKIPISQTPESIEQSYTPKEISSEIIKCPLTLFFTVKPSMSGLLIRNQYIHLMDVGKCDWGEDLVFYFRLLAVSSFKFVNTTVGIYRLDESGRGVGNLSIKARLDLFNKVIKDNHVYYTGWRKVSNVIYAFLLFSRLMFAYSYKRLKRIGR